MAHKIKVRALPHMNADGKPSATKKDYIVRCKRRGHVCTHEMFSSRAAADAYVDEHWGFVKRRKNRIALDLATKRRVERSLPGVRMSIYTRPDNQNFQKPSVRRARQNTTGVRAA